MKWGGPAVPPHRTSPCVGLVLLGSTSVWWWCSGVVLLSLERVPVWDCFAVVVLVCGGDQGEVLLST